MSIETIGPVSADEKLPHYLKYRYPYRVRARRRSSGLICAYLPRPGIEQPGPDGLTCRSPAGPGTPQKPALCAGRFAQNINKITVFPIFLQPCPVWGGPAKPDQMQDRSFAPRSPDKYGVFFFSQGNISVTCVISHGQFLSLQFPYYLIFAPAVCY